MIYSYGTGNPSDPTDVEGVYVEGDGESIPRTRASNPEHFFTGDEALPYLQIYKNALHGALSPDDSAAHLWIRAEEVS